MSRAIKFRAWNEPTEQMFPVMVLSIKGEGFNHIQILGKVEKHNSAYATPSNRLYKNFILMQYTDLKDKNGKEIYEGDIVKSGSDFMNPAAPEYPSDPNPNNEPWTKFHENIEVVQFWNGAFIVDDGKPDTHSNTLAERMDLTDGSGFPSNIGIEVIGNIYENKELLK